jgi:hypothetical protein
MRGEVKEVLGFSLLVLVNANSSAIVKAIVKQQKQKITTVLIKHSSLP